MPEEPILLYKGQRFVVECAVQKNGASESKQFIESLDKGIRAKIISIIKRFSDFGFITNREQFKKVDGKIWEFKHYQTRVLMYHCAKGCIALTHGFFKKTNKIPRIEIERANRIMEEYNEIREGFCHEK